MVFWHIFLVIFLWIIFYNFYWKRRNLPPGPIPWPFVGSIPLLFWEKPGTGAEIFLRWRKKYGPIYCYWIGEIPIVTVNDYDAMIESFVKNPDVFTGKFTIPKMDKFFRGGTYGIVFTEGELWKEQRRFALQVFRNLGMGRNVIEEKILDEVSGMIECLTTDSQYDVCDLPWRFEVCVGSIINSLLFGYRFEGEKLKEFKFLKKLLSRHMRSIADPYTMMLVQDVDLLKHIFQKTYKKYEENRNHFFGFFNQQIEEHEKEIILDSIDEPTDYVEAFLRIMHENEKKGIKETNY
uniref:Cytochrome P450 n=1 Tax=Panagrolaimus sp. JU765 TaxID=591449 RepID=A0AC34Q2S2_9BILA